METKTSDLITNACAQASRMSTSEVASTSGTGTTSNDDSIVRKKSSSRYIFAGSFISNTRCSSSTFCWQMTARFGDATALSKASPGVHSGFRAADIKMLVSKKTSIPCYLSRISAIRLLTASSESSPRRSASPARPACSTDIAYRAELTTRTSSPSTTKARRSPLATPSRSRTDFGTVTCPFAITFADSINAVLTANPFFQPEKYLMCSLYGE